MSKVKSIGKFSSLSDRESEVAYLILEGIKTNDIASKLNVKSNTVSTLKKNIFLKVGVESSIQLYKMAINEGVLV
jgi:DNA-binding NarL/FixJ family response regulator